MKRRNRSAFRTILSSPVTLVLSVIALIVIARAAININSKASDSALRLAEIQSEIAKLEENERKLQGQLAGISSDEGIISEIREKFHAVEPGEQVAVIVNSDEGKTSRVSSSGTSTKRSWWQRLFGIGD